MLYKKSLSLYPERKKKEESNQSTTSSHFWPIFPHFSDLIGEMVEKGGRSEGVVMAVALAIMSTAGVQNLFMRFQFPY